MKAKTEANNQQIHVKKIKEKWSNNFDLAVNSGFNNFHQILYFLQSNFSSLSLNNKKILCVCPCS